MSKKLFIDESQRYTQEGLDIDRRVCKALEALVLQEMAAGASVNDLELIMYRAVGMVACEIRLDHRRHVTEQAARLTKPDTSPTP